MPVPVYFLQSHRVQSRSLFGLSSQIAACKGGRLQHGALQRAGLRWAHAATQRSHYEAKVENIRNIGIIAHVDAVRSSHC